MQQQQQQKTAPPPIDNTRPEIVAYIQVQPYIQVTPHVKNNNNSVHKPNALFYAAHCNARRITIIPTSIFVTPGYNLTESVQRSRGGGGERIALFHVRFCICIILWCGIFNMIYYMF